MTRYKFNNILKTKKVTFFILFLFSILILFYFLYSFNFKFSSYGLNLFLNYITNLFKFQSDDSTSFKENLWIINLRLLWITLKVVFSGSVLGLFLAFITSYFSVLNIRKKNYISFTIRVLIIFLRSFPILIAITLFSNIFKGQLIATIIFFYSTWLWMHRYFCDIIEASDTKSFWIHINLEQKRFKSFWLHIVINNKNKFIMHSLMSIESNLRWNSILGSIGIVGIGFLFKYYETKFEFLSISILYIVIFIMLFELILFLLNKYLFVGILINKVNINTNKSLKYNYKKIIYLFLFLILLILLFWNLIDIYDYQTNWKLLWLWLKGFLNPNFSDILNKPSIYMIYLDVFKLTYTSLYIGSIFAFFISLFMSEKLFSIYIFLPFRFFITLLKTIPVIVYYILFSTFSDVNFALLSSLIIIIFRTLSKQFAEVINKTDISIIKHWITLGYSRFFIYKNILIMKNIKEIISLIAFEFEGTFRNVITYGIFANINLYLLVKSYEKFAEYGKIVPIFLPAIILYFLTEIVYLFIKINLKKKILYLFLTKIKH